MQEAIKKADVLIEALPYIKAFHGKTIVIKYGGSILDEDKIRQGVIEDIVFLNFIGIKTILVHGGGPQISQRMKAASIKTEFIEGMRYTDETTLKIVSEELAKLNKKLVSEIYSHGVKVKGLLGEKDDIIFAEKRKAKKDLGLVGEISEINVEKLHKILEKENILVISPMGKDKKGTIYNINADDAASQLAGMLKAEKFVLLTNVLGIMRDVQDNASLISTLNISEAKKLVKDKVVSEGMIPKVNSCVRAIELGVKKTHVIDARIPHALLLEIFTNTGIGTEIIK
ncbi:MAG: acetylglutamate kinase [Candidatus Omnitrophota bacterium]